MQSNCEINDSPPAPGGIDYLSSPAFPWLLRGPAAVLVMLGCVGRPTRLGGVQVAINLCSPQDTANGCGSDFAQELLDRVLHLEKVFIRRGLAQGQHMRV